MNDLIRAMRPAQWVKNLLVFAAPGAAGVLNASSSWSVVARVFIGFCAVSSALYLVNDVVDRAEDRAHPVKRHRPIAAGAVSVSLALATSAVLAVAGVVIVAWAGGAMTLLTVGVYVAVTLAYNAGLRQVAVIDLLAVASGFVLRAVAGAVAVDVPMSTWFVLCVSFGALFVVTGKRYAEFVKRGDRAVEGRSSLGLYTVGYLRSVLTVSVTVSILTYCLWAFESDVASGSVWFVVSIVPVVGVFLRYLLVLDTGGGAAPEEVFWRDRPIQLLGLVWLVVYLVAVYS